MQRSQVFLLALAVTLFCGCGATPYQASGWRGGFGEKKINDSTYLVAFQGNGYASQARVHYFWLYRCAELTVQNGYDYFVIHPKDSAPKDLRSSGGSLVPAVYRPSAQGAFIKVHSGGTVYIPYYGGGSTAQHWTSAGVILMFRRPLPTSLLFAFDARSILAQLGPYVTSEGKATPPRSDELLRSAFVAHAQVGFGTITPIYQPTAPAAAASSAGLAAIPTPRMGDEMRQRIDDARLLFYAAYQDHQLRSPDPAPGTVVIAFRVEPGGNVSEVHLLSSSIADPIFTDAVVSRMRQIDFGALNTPGVTVTAFPIAFAPLAQ